MGIEVLEETKALFPKRINFQASMVKINHFLPTRFAEDPVLK
jgi:hypothetical protein